MTREWKRSQPPCWGRRNRIHRIHRRLTSLRVCCVIMGDRPAQFDERRVLAPSTWHPEPVEQIDDRQLQQFGSPGRESENLHE